MVYDVHAIAIRTNCIKLVLCINSFLPQSALIQSKGYLIHYPFIEQLWKLCDEPNPASINIYLILTLIFLNVP